MVFTATCRQLIEPRPGTPDTRQCEDLTGSSPRINDTIRPCSSSSCSKIVVLTQTSGKSKVFVAALVLLALSCSANAQSLDTELTAFGGYRFGGTFNVSDSDAAYELEDAASFGLIWNHRYQANTQWEVFYSSQDAQASISQPSVLDSSVDIKTQILQVGGTYLWDGDTLQPYLVATLGGTYVKAVSGGSASDTFVSGSIGLGVKVAPSARVGLRLEARAHGALVNKSSKLFCETGPDLNVCAIAIDGDLFGQFEAYAGIVFRF